MFGFCDCRFQKKPSFNPKKEILVALGWKEGKIQSRLRRGHQESNEFSSRSFVRQKWTNETKRLSKVVLYVQNLQKTKASQHQTFCHQLIWWQFERSTLSTFAIEICPCLYCWLKSLLKQNFLLEKVIHLLSSVAGNRLFDGTTKQQLPPLHKFNLQ